MVLISHCHKTYKDVTLNTQEHIYYWGLYSSIITQKSRYHSFTWVGWKILLRADVMTHISYCRSFTFVKMPVSGITCTVLKQISSYSSYFSVPLTPPFSPCKDPPGAGNMSRDIATFLLMIHRFILQMYIQFSTSSGLPAPRSPSAQHTWIILQVRHISQFQITPGT